MKRKILFPLLLLGMAVPLCLTNQRTGVSAEFIGEWSQSSDKNNYTKAGSALNERICDEGFVLLKNENNFLPMKGNEKISLVGKSSGNLVRGGGGSGSGSVNGEENWQLTRDSGGNTTIKGSLEETYIFERNCTDLLGSYNLLAVQFLINKLISLLELIKFAKVESIVCHRINGLIVRHRFELLLDAEQPACYGRCRNAHDGCNLIITHTLQPQKDNCTVKQLQLVDPVIQHLDLRARLIVVAD